MRVDSSCRRRHGSPILSQKGCNGRLAKATGATQASRMAISEIISPARKKLDMRSGL